MKEFIALVENDTFDKEMRILQVSHNGGAGWSTIAFYSTDQALQIIAALQQSMHLTGESVPVRKQFSRSRKNHLAVADSRTRK